MWLIIMWLNYAISLGLFLYSVYSKSKHQKIITNLSTSLFLMTIMMSTLKYLYDSNSNNESTDLIFAFLLILGNGLLGLCFHCWFNRNQ